MIIGDPWKPLTIHLVSGEVFRELESRNVEQIDNGYLIRMPTGKIRFYPMSSVRFVEYEEMES